MHSMTRRIKKGKGHPHRNHRSKKGKKIIDQLNKDFKIKKRKLKYDKE